jgi:hypothetical protein
MSTQYDSGFVTFDNTAAALAKNIRVKVNSSGQVLVSGAANDAIGITQEDALASTRVAVKLFSAEGTFLATADADLPRSLRENFGHRRHVDRDRLRARSGDRRRRYNSVRSFQITHTNTL